MVARIVSGRTIDVAILLVYLASLVVMAGYIRDVKRTTVYAICLSTENLKAGQREEALATIAGDRAFLKAHPGGTDQFPESVVLADIAAKQKTVDRYPPRQCVK